MQRSRLSMERLPIAAARRPDCLFAVEEALRAALGQDRFLLAFQPVVSALTSETEYFECLLRIRDPADRLVPCGDFIAVAEQTGLIGLIDRHVLGLAFTALADHPSVRLGFNVSARTACDRQWLRALIGRLRERPEHAARLVVEITETAARDNLVELARFVDALRGAGCRVALDDFGAGYTSLRHLQALNVDIVKIDGAFVRSLLDQKENRIILRHLLGLTRGFGLGTVAECVETAAEAALLRAEGVGYLQGYHLGPPTTEQPWRKKAALSAD